MKGRGGSGRGGHGRWGAGEEDTGYGRVGLLGLGQADYPCTRCHHCRHLHHGIHHHCHLRHFTNSVVAEVKRRTVWFAGLHSTIIHNLQVSPVLRIKQQQQQQLKELRAALAKSIAGKLAKLYGSQWGTPAQVAVEIEEKGPSYEGTSQGKFWADIIGELKSADADVADGDDPNGQKGKGKRPTTAVVAAELLPRAIKLDLLGRPISSHEAVERKEQKEDEYPINTWLKSQMCNE